MNHTHDDPGLSRRGLARVVGAGALTGLALASEGRGASLGDVHLCPYSLVSQGKGSYQYFARVCENPTNTGTIVLSTLLGPSQLGCANCQAQGYLNCATEWAQDPCRADEPAVDPAPQNSTRRMAFGGAPDAIVAKKGITPMAPDEMLLDDVGKPVTARGKRVRLIEPPSNYRIATKDGDRAVRLFLLLFRPDFLVEGRPASPTILAVGYQTTAEPAGLPLLPSDVHERGDLCHVAYRKDDDVYFHVFLAK